MKLRKQTIRDLATIVVFLALAAVAVWVFGCSQVQSLLHSGASDYLACHNAEGEPAYAEDDISEDAVACRETFRDD